MVWPEEQTREHLAGTAGRWTLEFEVGPLGIQVGGAVYFQVPPFWGWSTPQTRYQGRPGFVEISGPDPGAEFEAETVDAQLLRIEVAGRALVAGERLRLVYGAGAAGALGDRFAEPCSRFVFAVDADGDGVREPIADEPCVEVLARPALQWCATWDSTLQPGQTGRLVLAALDDRGNLATDFEGTATLESRPSGSELPALVEFLPEHRGTRHFNFSVADSSTHQLRVSSAPGSALELLPAQSNPLRVSRAPRLLWMDLHGHSSLSDGTGSPEGYFEYARDVARLDVAALTDHDHWGFRPLDRNPNRWERILQATRGATRPDQFLALHGYEWTSWIYGHRHVVHFDPKGPLYSSLDSRYDQPAELSQALAPWPALSIPHHPAGGPIAIDWSRVRPSETEPLVELVSVHGSSADVEDPRRIYSAVPEHFALDALRSGLQFGFLGSGDSHDGHPGLPQLAAPTGGLTAVLCESLDPNALLSALRKRHTYATTGARLILRGNIAGQPMGSSVHRTEALAGPGLLFEVIGTGPLSSLDLLGPEGLLARFEAEGESELRGSLPLPEDFESSWLALRVIQEDGERAWGSPFFFSDS